MAVRLWEQQGSSELTVLDIAQAAGVSRRTFSNYFDSKTDALLAVGDGFNEAIVLAVRDAAVERDPARALLRTITMIEPEAWQPVLLVRRMMSADLALAERSGHLTLEFIETICSLVAERTGIDPQDLTLRSTARAVMGIVEACLDEVAGKQTDPNFGPAATRRLTDLLETNLRIVDPSPLAATLRSAPR